MNESPNEVRVLEFSASWFPKEIQGRDFPPKHNKVHTKAVSLAP